MAEHGRGLSASLLLLVALLAFLYAGLPSFARPRAAPPRALPGTVLSYHGTETLPARTGPCEGCHGRAPHRRSLRSRAFLNLHTRSLRCGVCHLSGPGLSIRKPSASSDEIAVGATAGSGWTPVELPASGVELRPSGPPCSECHRRGSPILSSGLFDSYRQRILEDLSLFYRIGKGAP